MSDSIRDETPDATPRPVPPMSSGPRLHILHFRPGERFRYDPDGEIFVVTKDPKGRLKARREAAPPGTPEALLDIRHTYVLAVDQLRGGRSDWDDLRSDWDGLGLSGFDPDSDEEGGAA